MEIKETKYFSLDIPEKIGIRYIIRYSLAIVLSLFYKCYMNIFSPVTIDKEYNVSICAIFRDEAKYLKEWITFHLLVGVDHFYLYNNFSEDDYMSVLQPFIDDKKVTLIDWPVKLGQLSAYADCIEKFSHQSKWIGFIDLDEFVVPNKKNTIYEILKPFEKNRPAVLLYWKFFGTSGKMRRNEEALIIEDFTICWKKYVNMGKCFFNTKYAFDAKSNHNTYFHHSLWGKYKGVNLPPVNVKGKPVIWNIHRVNNDDFSAQINHYVVKSYKEYWDKKAKMGGGTHDVGMHDKEYFFDHESKCQASDFHIFRFLVRVKEKMMIDL